MSIQFPAVKIGKIKVSTAWLGLPLSLLLLICLMDYINATTIKNISNTHNVEARNGSIRITYTSPISTIQYKPSSTFYTSIKVSDDQRTETHTLINAPYNASLDLIRVHEPQGRLINFEKLPKKINVQTAREKISLARMIPRSGSSPTPESMDNQLVLQFIGNVIGEFKQGENISVDAMDVVKLTPAIKGYYRWNSPSQLAFNFTEDSPQFNTTYQFDIDIKKLIKPKTQQWVGKKNTYKITTASNQVFVKDISLNGKVHWQAPLRIEFSGNMVGALDVLKIKSPDIVPIDISPKTAGTWRWINARTIEFKPDRYEGWPTRQNVTVAIKPLINQDIDRTWRGGEQAHLHSFYVLPRKQSITSYNL
ncbi:MAG: hypothetical protein Q9M20_04285, partial [Mariprofundaceae bacterium]|nr:hypothetical protein [Mariprofundaceae bacterium]